MLTFRDKSTSFALNPVWIAAVVSLWLTVAANLALWQAVALATATAGVQRWLFFTVFGVIIFAAQWLITLPFAFKPLIKWLLAALCLIATACAYFMQTYGVLIDESMIINSLQTDPREVRDLLDANMLVSFAGIALPALLFLYWVPVKKTSITRQSLFNLGSMLLAVAIFIAAIFISFAEFASLMRNHKSIRFQITPLNALWALGQIATKPLRHTDQTLKVIGLDAKQSDAAKAAKPRLIIYIVGETARAANFSLNGYSQVTNPKLSALSQASDGSVLISYSEVASCGTSTATSLPCMFSPLGKDLFNSSTGNSEGLLDVLQRAGIRLQWLDNNSGCKGTCDRIPNTDLSNQKDPALCTKDECYDEILLKGFRERVKTLGAPSHTTVVLHQKGSHGPAYYLRVPPAFKTFTPECLSNQLQTCERQAIINSYDNTIVYTDHVLASAIDQLKSLSADYDTGLIYVSDHGESLGENNTYLHGLPYSIAPKVQKHVPLIVWLSSGLQGQLNAPADCLKSRKTAQLSHDNLFHSLLGMNRVETALYRKDQDIFAQCSK